MLGGVALVAGCQVHQAGHESPVQPPGSFEASGEAERADRWWQSFDDPALNRLERQALDQNFDLRAARDQLRAARAVTEREEAGQFPTLDLSVSAERSWNDGEGFNQTGREVSTRLVAEYEVDLWQRLSARSERARLEQAATRADLKTAAITLSANVASSWYELVQQRGQRALLKAQIETNESVLRIVRRQFAQGQVRASDVQRQQRLLESTRQQLSTVQSQIEVLEHQLLVLTGRSPTDALELSRQKLPAVPPPPQPGLPGDLVHRRPDVRAAFYGVRAADRGIAGAIADRYPRLTLSLTGSTSDDQTSDLFRNWMQSIAGDLVTPLFDAGRRRAEVRRTRSVKAQRLDEYAQAVLEAFREVEDAAARERHQREQIESLRRQLDLAKNTYQSLRRQYPLGNISYIDVLEALSQQQQLERDLLRRRFELIENRIALYRALAGGWEGIVPPAEGENASEGEGRDDGEASSDESASRDAASAQSKPTSGSADERRTPRSQSWTSPIRRDSEEQTP